MWNASRFIPDMHGNADTQGDPPLDLIVVLL